MNTMRPLQPALSRWEDDGGALAAGGHPSDRHISAAEVMQLRIRVIALENLVIGLLAMSTPGQLHRIRSLAAYISPRPGFTRHRSTLHAAAQMRHLVERAGHFRTVA